MMKNKKALVMSVLCAVASVGFVMSASAADLHGNLDEIVVEGRADVLPGGMVSKEASMGILGNKDVMDVPFQTTTLTEKTITTFGGPNQPLQSVLINNPAVRSVGTTLHNDGRLQVQVEQNLSSNYISGIHLIKKSVEQFIRSVVA